MSSTIWPRRASAYLIVTVAASSALISAPVRSLTKIVLRGTTLSAMSGERSEAECLLGDEGAVDRRGGLLTGHPVVIAVKRSRASTRKRGESFSATVARLIEAGARAKRGRRSPRYISSGKALTSRAG